MPKKSIGGVIGLTARQSEIALLLAEGLTAREIGHRLNISDKTVEFHKHKIYEKLGVQSAAMLVRFLIHQGYIKP